MTLGWQLWDTQLCFISHQDMLWLSKSYPIIKLSFISSPRGLCLQEEAGSSRQGFCSGPLCPAQQVPYISQGSCFSCFLSFLHWFCCLFHEVLLVFKLVSIWESLHVFSAFICKSSLFWKARTGHMPCCSSVVQIGTEFMAPTLIIWDSRTVKVEDYRGTR